MLDQNPPLSGPSGEDTERIDITRKMRRLLENEHEQDLKLLMIEELGSVRREAWGRPDMSTNMVAQVFGQLAHLYDRPPTISHRAADVGELAERVADAGLWELGQLHQRDTLCLREQWLYVGWYNREGEPTELVYESIPPDLIIARADPRRPDVPVELWHARLREGADAKRAWCWDYVSIRNPLAPRYQVLSQDGKTDRSSEFSVTGWPDQWRTANGAPILPYVLYHAQRTGRIYKPRANQSLYEGALYLCLYRSYFKHVMKTSAYRQKYAVDVALQGLTTEGTEDGGRSTVIPDPSVVLMFRSVPNADGGVSPQLGAFEASFDPMAFMEAVEAYTRTVLVEAGLGHGADQLRQSGDPRSGYAVHVTRQAQLEAQQVCAPQFARADAQVLRVSATILNRVDGTAYPEEAGYVVDYHLLGEAEEADDGSQVREMPARAGGVDPEDPPGRGDRQDESGEGAGSDDSE